MGETAEVFKAYDIRGTVPDQLDADMCRAVGAAFARFGRAPRILVGRDMRASGVELSAAFAEGARAEGVAVTDLGMISTDCCYFASGHFDAPAAMFTASHNPASYNGIKLCLAGAAPLGRDTGLAEIEAAVNERLPGAPGPPRAVAPLDHVDVLGAFGDHVRSFVDTAALRPLYVTSAVVLLLLVGTRALAHAPEAAGVARHRHAHRRGPARKPATFEEPTGASSSLEEAS